MFRLRVLLLTLACVLGAGDLLAQNQAVTLHSAILRSGPKKTSTRIGTIAAGEVVELLPHGHRTGYYRVQTQNEEIGWVTESALRLLDETELHHAAPADPAPLGAVGGPVSVIAGAFDGCAIEGNPSPKGARFHEIQERNRLKNRNAMTADSDLDSSVTLARLLGNGTDDTGRFDEGKAAEVTGWVLHVKPGGKEETTNCRKGDPEHRDAHIELVLSPTDTLKPRRVIIEVTPRWRAALKAAGVDWSTVTLQHGIEHQWITVRGWLFFDSEHTPQAENTNPGADGNWRGTVWELHPVTKLQVVPKP